MLAQFLGVRYVYEREDSRNGKPFHELVLTPSALAGLSDEIRMQFTQALITLDIENLRTLITHLRTDNMLLADTLEELVNTYQFEKLSALFKGEDTH
jgi:hypothetical protein